MISVHLLIDKSIYYPSMRVFTVCGNICILSDILYNHLINDI